MDTSSMYKPPFLRLSQKFKQTDTRTNKRHSFCFPKDNCAVVKSELKDIRQKCEEEFKDVWTKANEIDHLITEFESRFSHANETSALALCLLPSNLDLLTDEKISTVEKFFEDDLPSPSALKGELRSWKREWTENANESIPESIEETLKVTNDRFYPNIAMILRLLLMLPVSAATVERSHSSFKQVKTKLRSTTTEDRMNALLLLYIYKDALDFSKIIDISNIKSESVRMKYKSTRGGVSGLSFQDALYTGYAADGGILVPESIPVLDMDTLRSWSSLSYIDLAKKIVPLFVDEHEIPASDLNDLLDKAFAKFTHQEIAPIQRLKNGLNIMELFHGTTWAFKDLALSCVGQFLEYFLSKQKKHLTLVVGTSGDTGSAAIEAVKGFEYVDIIVLLPKGRCSKVQEQQMITAVEKNVHVYRVEGTSDDLDIPIKEIFKDVAFTKKHNLSSINSINWSRIMVQIVHYIFGYLQMCPRCDGEVEIIVPTGACGNVTSGFIAKLMGVPIKFVCAVTQNDIVARAITKGDYSMSDSVIPTLAPAMDIQIPYNMERLWYLITQDSELICKLMTEFESN
ncbi:Hypothetical predicted protein, partial [Mytilus galloprovincialis]